MINKKITDFNITKNPAFGRVLLVFYKKLPVQINLRLPVILRMFSTIAVAHQQVHSCIQQIS